MKCQAVTIKGNPCNNKARILEYCIIHFIIRNYRISKKWKQT